MPESFPDILKAQAMERNMDFRGTWAEGGFKETFEANLFYIGFH